MRWVIAAIVLSSCSSDTTEICTVSCTADADCPAGQTCGELNRCTTGEACQCTPGEFLACGDPDTARFCDSGGTAIASEACNTFGCDQGAGRCNECVANEVVCRDGDTVVETCGPDGLVATTEACAAGCVSPNDAAAARCRHIEPVWLSGVCDTPAAMAAYTAPPNTTTMIDTSVDATCTGGILQQKNGADEIIGPDICVMRAGTVSLDGTVKVTQTQTPSKLRVIAFVADGALDVAGTVDVSADGTRSGPGGGYIRSGEDLNIGDGGAGFKQVGGTGGGGEFTSGGAGGAVRDPLLEPAISGGSRPERAGGIQPALNPTGGGGGGALLLVSCRDTVTVSGKIDAGGGGGTGGADTSFMTSSVTLRGGAGGGAGGYVVLQGTEIVVTGEIYANGGGGGGGCNADNCNGMPGNDAKGLSSTGEGGTGGGGSTSGDGAGGAGGHGTTPPEGGRGNDYSPGGGGGSTGRIQIYTPSGVTPMLTPAVIEPPFEPNRTVPTL